jgi:acetyl esterase/lipase
MPSIGVREILNVPYVAVAPGKKAEREHLLDIYVPQYRGILEGPRPVIIWIHGGAWYMGDKSATPARILPQLGYIAVSINYRLSGEAPFPAQLSDCQQALIFVRQHISEYGGDPNRIGLWGVSAGGHLAALLALAPELSGDAQVATLLPQAKRAVQAVCNWAGPSDLNSFVHQCAPDNSLKPSAGDGSFAKLLGGPLGQRQKVAQAASPVTYVNSQTQPFLVVHGSDDDVVPLAQSIEFEKALRDKGGQSQLLIIPHTKHDDLSSPTAIQESLNFFDKHLKSPAN